MVNRDHVETEGVFAGTATRKLTNTQAVMFSYHCRGRWFIFTKQIVVVLFWVIIYGYLQKFFKRRILKKPCTIHRKTPLLESLFNQPVVCYFFNKKLRHRSFLVNFAKLSRTPFLRNTFGLLLLYLLNVSVISQNLILISESGFPTIWDTHKYWNVYMWNQNYVNVRNYSLSSLLIL